MMNDHRLSMMENITGTRIREREKSDLCTFGNGEIKDMSISNLIEESDLLMEFKSYMARSSETDESTSIQNFCTCYVQGYNNYVQKKNLGMFLNYDKFLKTFTKMYHEEKQ